MEDSDVEMMTDPWSKDLILEFISLYEKAEPLWNPNNSDYKAVDKRTDAWKEIQANISVKMRIEDLKRKKDSLLATYRSLRRKIIAQEKKGRKKSPQWFAYKSLDRIYCKIGKGTSLKNLATCGGESGSQADINGASNHRNLRKRLLITKPPFVSQISSCDCKADTQQSMSEPFTFGQSVGLQLNEVERRQRIIAEKVISEVLFHAKLGRLQESSTVMLSQWTAEDEADVGSHHGEQMYSQEETLDEDFSLDAQ